MRHAFIASMLALMLLAARLFADAGPESVTVSVRGQTVALMIYCPSADEANAKGTIIMGSGDVGWLGVAASMSEFLRSQGYIVIGINAREYLAAFTTRGGQHLLPSDVLEDYAALAVSMRSRGALVSPVVASGMSEGAALAVLAAAAPANHSWLSGVITMGLPPTAELAWRWSDVTAWITRKDSGEPSFAPKDYVAAISPLPLYMIQSTKDEYVADEDYRALDAAARQPKKLVLISAANHRFTDKIAELRQAYLAGLSWMTAARQ